MRTRPLHSRFLPPRRQIAVCLAVVAVPFALLGCGSEEDSGELEGEPFSEQEMTDFTEKLDDIDGLVTDGDCDGAKSKVTALIKATDLFPSDRDEGLKADLIAALGDLDQQISDQCVEEGAEAESSSTTSTETETESTPTVTDVEPEETTDSSTDETEEEPPTPPEEKDPSVPEPEVDLPPIPEEDDGSGGVSPGLERDGRAAAGGGR